MGKSLFFECEWGAKSNRGKTGTAKTDIHERQTTQHTKIICVFILWELLSHCARRLPSAVVSFAVRWCLMPVFTTTTDVIPKIALVTYLSVPMCSMPEPLKPSGPYPHGQVECFLHCSHFFSWWPPRFFMRGSLCLSSLWPYLHFTCCSICVIDCLIVQPRIQASELYVGPRTSEYYTHLSCTVVEVVNTFWFDV